MWSWGAVALESHGSQLASRLPPCGPDRSAELPSSWECWHVPDMGACDQSPIKTLGLSL